MTTPLATVLCAALAALAPGDPAFDFEVRDSAGERVALAELRARGPVVLAFFPRPFTPGCSREMAALVESARALAERGAQVVAVSRSDREKMAAFRADRRASFPFVADDGSLARRFGAGAGPFTRRVTFVIDRGGAVTAVLAGDEALDMRKLLAALPPAPAPAPPASPG